MSMVFFINTIVIVFATLNSVYFINVVFTTLHEFIMLISTSISAAYIVMF